MAILEVLLGILVVAVLILVVLGATPVLVDFRLSRDPDARAWILLTPLGGMLPAITLADSARPRTAKVKAKAKGARSRRRRRGHRGIAMRTATDLFWQLIACVEIRHLDVEGRFGTGDPAETGQLYGLVTPLVHGLGPACRRTRIDLRPEFGEACLEGHLSGRIAVTPFRLIPPVARFGWSMLRP